eukprot:TRINITY_DN9912_c0_g1_i4.p1 TRINITY_DN9912_c0_g1~~TRINITY_DN9912_c0_g1_i4.p1  ORF type:complete len:127 (+),score=4.03 TRINITY_DN9912_c0_g1_i4:107-487(+)
MSSCVGYIQLNNFLYHLTLVFTPSVQSSLSPTQFSCALLSPRYPLNHYYTPLSLSIQLLEFIKESFPALLALAESTTRKAGPVGFADLEVFFLGFCSETPVNAPVAVTVAAGLEVDADQHLPAVLF